MKKVGSRVGYSLVADLHDSALRAIQSCSPKVEDLISRTFSDPKSSGRFEVLFALGAALERFQGKGQKRASSRASRPSVQEHPPPCRLERRPGAAAAGHAQRRQQRHAAAPARRAPRVSRGELAADCHAQRQPCLAHRPHCLASPAAATASVPPARATRSGSCSPSSRSPSCPGSSSNSRRRLIASTTRVRGGGAAAAAALLLLPLLLLLLLLLRLLLAG